MKFNYFVSGTKQWNATNHKYTTNSNAAWTASGNTVAVTNHSNTDIKASFTYTQAVQTVTGTFSKEALTLDTAEGTQPGNVPSGSVTLTLGGTMNALPQDVETWVGIITVSIQDYRPET